MLVGVLCVSTQLFISLSYGQKITMLKDSPEISVTKAVLGKSKFRFHTLPGVLVLVLIKKYKQ